MLVVDEDNSLVLHAVKNILVNLGYEVIIVTEGKAALHALQSQSFDRVLLDIGLLDLGGTELARLYRQWEQENNKPHIPIFALTAHKTIEIQEKCEIAGMDYILNKPFTLKDIQIIKKFLGKQIVD